MNLIFTKTKDLKTKVNTKIYVGDEHGNTEKVQYQINTYICPYVWIK